MSLLRWCGWFLTVTLAVAGSVGCASLPDRGRIEIPQSRAIVPSPETRLGATAQTAIVRSSSSSAFKLLPLSGAGLVTVGVLAFLAACERFYAAHAIRIERVLTDNGTCFKRRWSDACAAHGIAVRKTRPYRPQTNGKAERFIRTLLERWAYAYPYAHESERLAALAPALDFYNRFRPHRALKGLTPLQRVNNVPGTNI